VAENRRQHYVSRMQLRKFSRDGKRTDVVVLDSGKRIRDVGIREQCYRDYYYGKDRVLEKTFRDTEGKFAATLGDLSAAHLQSISDTEIIHLRLYVLFQRMRTVTAATSTGLVFEAALKERLRPKAEAKGIDLGAVRIRPSNPQLLALAQATAGAAAIADLSVKFLLHEREVGFVISDHPVVICNQFVESHPRLSLCYGAEGWIVKGIQIIMPVSPRACIVMYDPQTYTCGSPRSRVVVAGRHDVRVINYLQAANGNKCLYYHPDHMSDEELDRIIAFPKKTTSYLDPDLHYGPMHEHQDGTIRQKVVVAAKGLRVGLKLGFMKTIETRSYADYDSPMVPPREGDIVHFNTGWLERINAKTSLQLRERPMTWVEHLPDAKKR
jgi:Protein of unknown function (DUF4238)